MGGEGILTIDFLILTPEVGFSPTFPKRGSNLVPATIKFAVCNVQGKIYLFFLTRHALAMYCYLVEVVF